MNLNIPINYCERTVFKQISMLRIVGTTSPVLVNKRLKSKSLASLVNGAVCPSTTSTVNILKDINVPEYEIVRELTDEILSVQSMLMDNKNVSIDFDQEAMNIKVEILQDIINKYKSYVNRSVYDSSYPFRHAMFIKHYHEEYKKNKWWNDLIRRVFHSKPKQKNNLHMFQNFKYCCKQKCTLRNKKQQLTKNTILLRV